MLRELLQPHRPDPLVKQILALPTYKVSHGLRFCLDTLGFMVGNSKIQILVHPVNIASADSKVAWWSRIYSIVSVLGMTRYPPMCTMSSERRGSTAVEVERLEERLPVVNVLPLNSEKQQMAPLSAVRYGLWGKSPA